MPDAPDLTVILGPVTPVSLRLNTLIRNEKAALEAAGCRAWPTRLATPALRSVVAEDLDPVSRGRRFAEVAGEGRAVLAAIGFFGHPSGGLAARELLPNMEHMLATLAGPLSLRPARVAFALDTLPEFFLAAQSDTLDARVRETPWETLYDLSWEDVVLEIMATLPKAEIAIMSGKGAAVRAPEAMEWLLGPAAAAMSDPFDLLKLSIDETGRAAFDRLSEVGTPADSVIGELYDEFRLVSDAKVRKERLGLDELTSILLEQRLDEDLQSIRQIEGITVF